MGHPSSRRGHQERSSYKQEEQEDFTLLVALFSFGLIGFF